MNNNLKKQAKQKAADTTKSVHLSASAGSGKTRALKERYLALLDVLDHRGLNIDQAVAITFTDKAAAEIKERVLRGLPEQMLKKIIRGRQDLRISTIHSFCMNLLKRYPLEAGLLPDFGVLDARDQAYKIQKAIEDALEESDQDAGIMAPLVGFSVDELISLIEFLIMIRSRLKRMEIDANGPDGLIKSIQRGMELGTAEEELRTLLTAPAWRSSFARMEALLAQEVDHYDSQKGLAHRILAQTDDPASAYKSTTALLPIYFTQDNAPRKAAKIPAKVFCVKSNRQEYETLFFKLQELLYQFTNTYQRAHAGLETVSILRLFQRAEAHYQEAKLKEGLLDFDDLEIYAYRLLQGLESPDILYWLDRKVLHFLVDEFQDTSDIQWAILNKLTEEIFSGQGADKPMQPTLFVVGDEKQSIYRFREANYRLIHTIREQMEKNIPQESREILTLDKNFRSTPEVIETVNAVFGGLWGAAYKPSEVERGDHTGSVRLIELAPDATGENRPYPAEAEVLALELRALVENKTTVYERSPDSPALENPATPGWKVRPAGYGDCAILIQSRTRLKEYETALQAHGIPYRVVGGIGFYEEDEIQALINVLFFLWNQDDNLALAAALKSPLFGLTDQDLLDLVQDSYTLVDSLERWQPAIKTMLEKWKGLARLTSLSVLLHTIIGDTGAYIRFGRQNPQALFNIDKLLDTAREFDRRGYTTLQDFVERVKTIKRTEQREATSDMNLPGVEGSVSIMTVHKAKGLEYPIVFLPGMNQPARSLTIGPPALIEERGSQVRMAIKDQDNPVYEDLWKGDQGEQEELRREHQRLLYVAMTRARDQLVMLGTLGKNKAPIKQNSWLDFLHQTLLRAQEQHGLDSAAVTAYAYPAWQPQVLELPAAANRQIAQEPARERAIDLQTLQENLAPLSYPKTPEWKRATDFIDQENDALRALFSQQPAIAGVSAITRGSVLHRCLEELAKNNAYELDLILREFPESGSLDSNAKRVFSDDIHAVLKSVLGKEDFEWIFERRNDSYAELPFLHKKEHVLVSGIIDRVVIKDKKGYVIDYKAIRVENDEALETWTSHYRPQIQIYCSAVKELFGLASVEGYLLFLDSNKLQLTIKE